MSDSGTDGPFFVMLNVSARALVSTVGRASYDIRAGSSIAGNIGLGV